MQNLTQYFRFDIAKSAYADVPVVHVILNVSPKDNSTSVVQKQVVVDLSSLTVVSQVEGTNDNVGWIVLDNGTSWRIMYDLSNVDIQNHGEHTITAVIDSEDVIVSTSPQTALLFGSNPPREPFNTQVVYG